MGGRNLAHSLDDGDLGPVTRGVDQAARDRLASRHSEPALSIDVENGRIVINFDDLKVGEEDIVKISKESIEKLGYKMTD